MNPLPKVSIRGPRGELSACEGKAEGRKGQHKAAHDVASARRRMALATVTLSGLKIVSFSSLRNLLRAKKFLDKDHSRSEVLFFQFWTMTETA